MFRFVRIITPDEKWCDGKWGILTGKPSWNPAMPHSILFIGHPYITNWKLELFAFRDVEIVIAPNGSE